MFMICDKSFYWGKTPRCHVLRVALQRVTSYQSLRSEFKWEKTYYWEYKLVWRVFNYAIFIWIDNSDDYGF